MKTKWYGDKLWLEKLRLDRSSSSLRSATQCQQIYLPCFDNNRFENNSERVVGSEFITGVQTTDICKLTEAVMVGEHKNFIFTDSLIKF